MAVLSLYMGRKPVTQPPLVQAYSINGAAQATPAALERQRTTRGQINFAENTIIWGENDDLPLRQLKAVDDSPTATSCLGTVENFIKGAKFSDEGLMTMPVDQEGTTLWEFHVKLAQYMSLLEGFSVQFTYDRSRKITNAYQIGTESCRFVNPPDGSRDISQIKYNPYFGTTEYNKKYTLCYDVFNLNTVAEGFKKEPETYNGQIYFYGRTRPLYRFYPTPRYWSGQYWIYVDGKIQKFHGSNLDNGFFQSVWMQVIGDPNAPSRNPEFQKTETGMDSTKRKVATKTQGQEFDERMKDMFSGADKAGTVFVSWAANKEQLVDLQPFPVNTNFDVLSGTFTDAIRGVTIATEVPAILANLPQQASSLGSDGNAMKAAIEIMQSRVSDRKQILQNFYNKILLPNMKGGSSKAEVKILDFIPVTSPVTVEDKFWEVLTPEDKRKFINENVPGLTVTEPTPAEPHVDPVTGETITPAKPNENLKSLGLRDWDRIAGLKTRFLNGKISQADVEASLLSYGFTKEEIDAWLQTAQPAQV